MLTKNDKKIMAVIWFSLLGLTVVVGGCDYFSPKQQMRRQCFDTVGYYTEDLVTGQINCDLDNQGSPPL
jgi:hypothetical protein